LVVYWKRKGAHWENIDEDRSLRDLLSGKPSAENQTSLKK
jgi:hypothetical protein